MKVKSLEIPDLKLVQPDIHSDDRGFFFESHNSEAFKDVGIDADFVQDNHSGSKRNTLRGLHYQIKRSQGKLISVLSGEIYDVAVDLRISSSTFKKWVGRKMSAEHHEQLWIPVGFAHGFLVLSEWAEVQYKVTDFYAPEWERTLLWSDPAIGIIWPLENGEQPLLSEKDAAGTVFADVDLFD
jgi:dTDP-4-dehydrorhamnose 3,5-epimerase